MNSILNRHNTIVKRAVLGLSLMSLSTITWAEEASPIGVIVTTDFGISSMEFDEKLDHEITFMNLTPGLTLTYDRFYASGKYAFTVSDADVSEEEDLGSANRTDFDLTLGYRLNKRASIFAGYHFGETEIDFVPRDLEDDSDLMAFTDTYEENGIHIGGSYSWPIGDNSILSANMAYAFFDADNTFNANVDEVEDAEEEIEFDDETGIAKGDSNGFSFGIRWTMSLTESLYYSASYKINKFQQDISINGNSYDVDETFSYITMGLNWVVR